MTRARCCLAFGFVVLVTAFAWVGASAQDTRQEPASEQTEAKPDEPAPAEATGPEPAPAVMKPGVQDSLCLIIESAARQNQLPVEFFARVIWQESRLQPNAVGPVTRSGNRAQGIAQFMPGTAAERRLLDPFDPVQALPKSAEFLRDLRAQFGNLGLAAAAYNAGPRRVQEWLDGSGYMPAETRNYVAAITGVSVDDWAKGREKPAELEMQRSLGCRELVALLKRAPNPFVLELEHRVERVAVAPWGVQLAAGFSRARALDAYARAIKRYGAVLGARDPTILSTLLRSRGTRAFYQVRAGADTRASADALCTRLRNAGGACLVLRNRGRA